jgi:3'-phosphoadenosine 5'-phosphosulfate (PAPS) 3'-phosphatase
MAVIDRAWLEDRVTATKAAIIATEEAILQLSSGAQSYTLDTGQTRQVVTKADIASLRLQLNELENRLAGLDAKLCGTGGTRIIPGW